VACYPGAEELKGVRVDRVELELDLQALVAAAGVEGFGVAPHHVVVAAWISRW